MEGLPKEAQLSRGIVLVEIESEQADRLIGVVAERLGGSVSQMEDQYRHLDRYDLPENERQPLVLVIDRGVIEKDVNRFAALISEARPLKITPIIRLDDPLMLPMGALDAVFGNIPNFLIGPVGDSVKSLLEERLGKVSVPETEVEAVLVYSDQNWQRQEAVLRWED